MRPPLSSTCSRARSPAAVSCSGRSTGRRVSSACSTPAARRSPAACAAAGRRADSNELIDPDALAHVRPVPWASAALDAADGSVVGVLLAAAYGDSPSPEQLSRLLVIAARLLSYEWESVSTRAAAPARRQRSRPPQRGPGDGSLARAALVEASEREWELSRRGTVETHVVVCHLRDRPDVVGRHGEALADLILRDVAEVLAEACAARITWAGWRMTPGRRAGGWAARTAPSPSCTGWSRRSRASRPRDPRWPRSPTALSLFGMPSPRVRPSSWPRRPREPDSIAPLGNPATVEAA